MTDIAQLKTALEGRYEIEREIGAGGMATVYLARDPRHERSVAVKVLNPELGAVLGVERFLSEIRVTANLQHPNLLPLFDSGEAGGLLFYVMPFVEGESLRARLEREKQLPIEDAINISVAIADALDYAHGHGVIHRDLKPENILLQHGQPVVADFGIALAVSNAGGNRITQTGLSLGTPQYMSPEQATGDRVIDGRSDIYSLAAMAYEMLTGEPPHIGSTSQAVIARVLTERPRPIRANRSAVPEYVEAALEHALEKLPADRFSKAHEFADALKGRGAPPSATQARTAAQPVVRGWGERLKDPLVVGLALVAVASLAKVALTRGGDTTTPVPPIRFVVSTPDSAPAVASFPWPAAISPNGDAVVYQARTEQPNQLGLWLLRTDQVTGHLIPGTAGAHQVIFSPDGQWIAYENGTKQWKLRLDGSTPVAIAEGTGSNGIDWTTRDEIVLGATGAFHGLAQVSASGGDLVEFTHPDSAKGETDHLWPIANPDGKTIAFTIYTGTVSAAQLAIATVGSPRVTPLGIKALRSLAWLDGYLVYLQADGTVMAVAASGTKVSGKPIPVHDRVFVIPGNNGNSSIYISRGGALVEAAGELQSRLAWMGRDGTTRTIARQAAGYAGPFLSPDGSHIATLVTADGKADVWTYDFSTSTLSRLTTDGGVTWLTWTADGRYIVYSAPAANGRSKFWRQLSAGGSPPEALYEAPELAPYGAIAPDQRSLMVMTLHDNTWDLVRVRLDSGAAASPFVASSAQEQNPAFSPDGKWVAYQADESGTSEVYVRSYPDPSTKVQVSAGGGVGPRWSADGSSIYYLTLDRSVVEAKVSAVPAFHVVSRGKAFPAGLSTTTGYSISRDGKQMLGLLGDANDFKLTAVPNWITEFRARVKPTGGK